MDLFIKQTRGNLGARITKSPICLLLQILSSWDKVLGSLLLFHFHSQRSKCIHKSVSSEDLFEEECDVKASGFAESRLMDITFDKS